MCEYKLHVKTCNLCLKYGLKYCFVLRFSPSFMSFYYDLCMHRSMSIWFFEQGGLNDYKSNFLMYIKYLHLVQHHLKVHIATLNFFASTSCVWQQACRIHFSYFEISFLKLFNVLVIASWQWHILGIFQSNSMQTDFEKKWTHT